MGGASRSQTRVGGATLIKNLGPPALSTALPSQRGTAHALCLPACLWSRQSSRRQSPCSALTWRGWAYRGCSALTGTVWGRWAAAPAAAGSAGREREGKQRIDGNLARHASILARHASILARHASILARHAFMPTAAAQLIWQQPSDHPAACCNDQPKQKPSSQVRGGQRLAHALQHRRRRPHGRCNLVLHYLAAKRIMHGADAAQWGRGVAKWPAAC